MKEVIVTIYRGVADCHSVPLGVKLKIVDFDVEGEPESTLDKFEGKACVIAEHGGERMKQYLVEIAEVQIWQIYLKVKAKDEQEAKEKAEIGEGEVETEKLRDVDHKEILDIEEIEK